MCHAGGCDRRLSEESTQSVAKKLLASMEPLLRAIRRPKADEGSVASPLTRAIVESVHIPEGLNPSLLLPHSEGNGMIVLEKDSHVAKHVFADGSAVHQTFGLDGLKDFGRLHGASVDAQGLLASSEDGKVAHCPGAIPESSGKWSCC